MHAARRATPAATRKIVAKVERAEAVCDQNAMDDIISGLLIVVMVARG